MAQRRPTHLDGDRGTRKGLSIESPDLDINVFGNPPTFEMPAISEFDMPHIMALMPSRRLGIEAKGWEKSRSSPNSWA